MRGNAEGADMRAPGSGAPAGFPDRPVDTRSVRLDADAIVDFARMYDPQAMHCDARLAGGTFFGELVASGWHVLALTMRLAVEARPLGDHPLIGVELSRIRFARPVPPGTEIFARLTPEGIRGRARGGHYGLLSVETIDAASRETLVHQGWRVLLP